jgi:sigma-B regulation protein RsbU (phosphoserine phosphatase)
MDIPIIFISALDDINDKMTAFHIGGVDYITKPFQVEEVIARVKTHIDICKLQKQLSDINQRFTRELALAGQIQASFLPRNIPQIPGWTFSAKLVPARETSGDFYDFVTLPDGKLGIIVADVVDKGAGAALFMAFSLSLIRTYLAEFPTQPAKVLSTVSQRILMDTQAMQFVTVFLGILDPDTHSLQYVNASQCPPIIIDKEKIEIYQKLEGTGVPLGIFEDAEWESKTIFLEPGQLLIIYTDGITEAQNQNGDFFGEKHLFEIIRSNIELSNEEIQSILLAKVNDYSAHEHPDDDIAVVILRRE